MALKLNVDDDGSMVRSWAWEMEKWNLVYSSNALRH